MKSVIKIIRPINIILVIAAVFLGSALCGIDELYLAIISALSAAFILAGGNVINDYFDIDVDRIVHPERPLPIGLVKPRAALRLAIVLMACGIALSFMLPLWCVFLALFVAAFLVLYSFILSRTPLVGNLTISLLSGISVIYGALAQNLLCEKAVWAGVIAGLIHLPREIFKDIEDIEGDRESGRKTLPVVWNPRGASYTGMIFCIIAMIAIVMPYVLKIFGSLYGSIASIAFVLCGVSAVFGIRGFPKSSQKFLKSAMVVGIIALWAEVVGKM